MYKTDTKNETKRLRVTVLTEEHYLYGDEGEIRKVQYRKRSWSTYKNFRPYSYGKLFWNVLIWNIIFITLLRNSPFSYIKRYKQLTYLCHKIKENFVLALFNQKLSFKTKSYCFTFITLDKSTWLSNLWSLAPIVTGFTFGF